VLRKLRSQVSDVPVLFLTAKDAVEDRIAGLTAGGDDYVTKPFRDGELMARVRAALRRDRRKGPVIRNPKVAAKPKDRRIHPLQKSRLSRQPRSVESRR